MNEIIAYHIKHMSDKKLICNWFDNLGIKYKKNDTYKNLADKYNNAGIDISLVDFCTFCKRNWQSAPISRHLENLSSGLLKGHSWHQAMPSMLHLSMQNKVRDYINEASPLDKLIGIGADIMKHEYFMVATHDICESTIINKIDNCIPSIRNKSISDFIFKGIPFDLKVTTYLGNLDLQLPCQTDAERKLLIKSLYEGVDSERIRKQATETIHSWGLNRFYIVVQNQDRWLKEPELLLQELLRKVNSLKDPIIVNIHSFDINFYLVEL